MVEITTKCQVSWFIYNIIYANLTIMEIMILNNVLFDENAGDKRK